MLFGFNPCFNGFFFSMLGAEILMTKVFRFNPCFNGFFFSIIIMAIVRKLLKYVSILVLMDSSFQYDSCPFTGRAINVSILVLMDSSFQWENHLLKSYLRLSFNPCFNGFFFSILLVFTEK